VLESVKIARRQSEIRQELATLAAKPEPSEDEVRAMERADGEYKQNEVRYRAALISEDVERRDAAGELETRGGREWADLVGKFELRQVALALDEGKALSGATLEVVQELRNAGGYRGVPVPWAALETRAGETVAAGVLDPKSTRPIIDRLFPASVAGRMGAEMIAIDHGLVEYPVVTQGASAAWATTETGAVGAAQAFQTTDKPLAPNNTYGVQMTLSRRAMKQSGAALEAAVRRDMNSAIAAGLDAAVFRGTGADGQPLGIIPGAATYSITSTAVNAAASWAAFRSAVTAFMVANAATGPGMVRALIRPELWDYLDAAYVTIGDPDAGLTAPTVTEWGRLAGHVTDIVMTSNALAAAAGSPSAVTAVLSTTAGGVAPVYVGAWGGVDLIRDPFSGAASGELRLTALATLDVTVSRPAQLRVLTGLQIA
jgi:HK97 family phage major capsid protein